MFVSFWASDLPFKDNPPMTPFPYSDIQKLQITAQKNEGI
jgi:hypothetical protein